MNAHRQAALQALARPPFAELARRVAGALVSAALVAAVTGVIFALRGHIPVLALAQLYLFAVIPVAVVWGLAYAVLVSVASMLAFNFFFLPPVHTFTLQDSSDWFALAVFLVTAVVVSDLAARSRRRAGESALLAEIAASLLEHGEVTGDLDRISAEAASALQVEKARIVVGDEVPVGGGERGSTYIFIGTPDERRRVEILRGSLLSRMVRELPGLDIRVIADRAQKEAQIE